ncbi:Transcription factor skn7 [Globisporangium polare]
MTLPAIATGFVRKLYRILDQESGAVISWTRGGTAFAIFDDDKLNELILPRYFRGRLCAFRQQLREHGFQQLVANASGANGLVPIAPVAPPVSANAQPHCTYFHHHFMRGAPGSLSQITRTPLPRRRVSSRKSKAVKRTASVVVSAPAVAPVVSGAPVGMASDSKRLSAKRARVGEASPVLSTSSSTASTSTSLSSLSSSSSTTSGSARSSVSPAIISIMKNCSLSAAPVFQQQQPLLHQQPHQQSVKANPLFSNESSSLFEDWLSLEDISLTGASSSSATATAAVTTDISFSEDMLGALMTLVSSSMTTAPLATVPEDKTCSAAITRAGGNGPICPAKKKALANGAVYETHQFSDDTINSMMLWLGSSGST